MVRRGDVRERARPRRRPAHRRRRTASSWRFPSTRRSALARQRGQLRARRSAPARARQRPAPLRRARSRRRGARRRTRGAPRRARAARAARSADVGDASHPRRAPPRRDARQVQPAAPLQRPEARAAVRAARRASRAPDRLDRRVRRAPASRRSSRATSRRARLPGVWFQADPGDADPATFFHYLRAAAAELPGRARRTPPRCRVFTAEYAGDLPAFTRRLPARVLRAVSRRARCSSSTTSTSPRPTPRGASRSPKGCAKFPTASTSCSSRASRRRPEMARLVGEQRITRIEWEALRFTAGRDGGDHCPTRSSRRCRARDPYGERRLGGGHRADARAPSRATTAWRRKRCCPKARKRCSSISPARSSGARARRTSAC